MLWIWLFVTVVNLCRLVEGGRYRLIHRFVIGPTHVKPRRFSVGRYGDPASDLQLDPSISRGPLYYYRIASKITPPSHMISHPLGRISLIAGFLDSGEGECWTAVYCSSAVLP